jgi:hypothetical protein
VPELIQSRLRRLNREGAAKARGVLPTAATRLALEPSKLKVDFLLLGSYNLLSFD